MADDQIDRRTDGRLDAVIARAEKIVYGAVSFVLVVAAFVALVHAGYVLATDLDDGARVAVEHTLDSLLVVFILVELLAAVRATIVERRLVAEPFLLVGIIASIKEIVVTGLFSSEDAEIGETMMQVATLGAVVLLLSVASLLLRRKEREPTE